MEKDKKNIKIVKNNWINKIINNRQKKTKKNTKKAIAILVITIIIVICIAGYFIVDVEKEKEEDRVAVTYKNNLTTEFRSNVKVSDFIESINGTLLEDNKIDTTSLGEKEITFKYKSKRNKDKTKTFKVNIVDTTKPKIFNASSSLTFNKGYSGDLTQVFLSGDDCDSSPKREIIGDYDVNTVGNYNLTFKITDASGNYETKDFTLKIVNPSGTTTKKAQTSKVKFQDAVNKYKNSKTSLGIDVSQWQGDIDWQKVKDAGAEFVFIRIGYQKGFDKENAVDPYFTKNIEGAKKVGLKVGGYFFSYAKSAEEAKEQANYVLDQIKDYEFDLPISFDWESFNSFTKCNLSFYDINNMAQTFIKTLENGGYDGMLYSSKNYLTTIWYANEYDSIWLAHYSSRTDYNGKFKCWQRANTGRISGINADVDIDVLEK